MTNDGGSGGDVPPPDEFQQTAHRIGEQLLDYLKAEGPMPGSAGRLRAPPAELGRMVMAFVQIEDPRVRSEFVALVEVIGRPSTH